MRVYRVESAEGIGPYRLKVNNRFVFQSLSDLHSSYSWDSIDFLFTEDTRPGLSFDFDNPHVIVEHGLVSGFNSLESCWQWFDDEAMKVIKRHRTRTLYLSVYQVHPRYVLEGRSKRQLVFDRTYAKLIESKPLDFSKAKC